MPAVELFKSVFRLGWAAGENAAGFLLQKHKKILNMKQITDFMRDDLDVLAQLMQLLLSDEVPQPDPTGFEGLLSPQDARKRQFIPKTLACSMKELFKTKKNADFEICLQTGASLSTIKCHSFVLYSRWAYFRRLVDSGMKEALQKRLVLSASDEPGGWDLHVLNAVVEVIYCGKNCPKIMSDIDTASAVRIHGMVDLYLVEEDESHLTSPFADLLKYCKDRIVNGISMENCIDIYRAAYQANAAQIIDIAKQFIIESLPEFRSDEAKTKELLRLPWESQLALLWHQLGRSDLPPSLGPISSAPQIRARISKQDESDGSDIQIDEIEQPAKKRRKIDTSDDLKE
jgi:hypothetical protein